MDNKIELLAPAGDLNKAKTAILYGADAIYCGTNDMSLRARADMNLETLGQTIEYVHSKGKKVYVTVNVFAFDELYEKIEELAKRLEILKPDGVIIADPGIFEVFKNLTTLDLHISTQANIVSARDVNFWHRLGAKRVILARELSFEQIKKILKDKEKQMEVEMFIHGAICFSYSGRCFLSDFMSCRSANQGDCSQSCRWSYNLYMEEKNNPGNLMQIDTSKHGTTILSSRDLCLINEIPQIIESGVNSLKIEGRLKTQYYIASVVNTYRCLIDEYLELKKNNMQEKLDISKYIDEIQKIKTREFTTLFYHSKQNKDIFDYQGRQYNDIYENAGIVTKKLDNNYYEIEIKNRLSKQDKLEILIPKQIKSFDFEIEELKDINTNENIDFISPGVKGQKVIIKIPNNNIDIGYVIRRKK